MELYTLTNTFFPKEFIGQFTSLIWTERYSSAGDVQLVVPPIPSMIEALAPGTLLGLRGVKEIMMVETQSIENGLLTVNGSSLVKFLNQREAWFMNPAYDGTDPSVSPTSDFTEITTIGQFLADVMNETVINPVAWGAPWNTINLDWGNEKIPGMALGRIDPNGDGQQLTFPIGPIYDGLVQVAAAQVEGFKLYLESASYSTDTYILRFATYRGKNRTRDQTANLMIRFSPALDSLTNVKEVSSIEAYKNTVYVYYKGQVSVHYIPTLPAAPWGFDRRSIMVNAPDIFLLPEHIAAFREQVARDALAHNVYIQAVDGRVSPQNDYKFGVDYYLGDVVELEGFSGLTSKARVTEYIRSQDQFGEQEYPTLSVIDPLGTNYIADPEPDSSWEPDWLEDPNWLDDWTEADLSNPLKDPRLKRQPLANPKDPIDPNPDPTPTFPTSGGGGPSGAYMVVGFFPDHSTGEVVGYLTFGGGLTTAWQYTPEDTGPDANTSWLEAVPKGWSFTDGLMVVQTEEDKESTDVYPWSRGWAFWYLGMDGSHTKLTETVTGEERTAPNSDGVTHGWMVPGELRGVNQDSWMWVVRSGIFSPVEWAYGEGIYSLNPALNDGLLEPGHGTRFGEGSQNRGPVELHRVAGSGSASGVSDLTKILGPENFPTHMRWSDYVGPYISPDSSKLAFSRKIQGPQSTYQIQAEGSVIGGTYVIRAELFGELGRSWFIVPIIYDSPADYVWYWFLSATTEVFADPRDHGIPGLPYGGGPLPGSAMHLRYVLLPPYDEAGIYITIGGFFETGPLGGTYSVQHTFGDIGRQYWYICDADGSNLEEIDLTIPSVGTFLGWSDDSTKIHGVVSSAGGRQYSRWMVYDLTTSTVSFPLDYSSSPSDSNGYGPLKGEPKFSPDSQKIVWFTQGNYSDPKSIWIANADGSSAVEVYTESTTDASDQSALFVPGTGRMAWSLDSRKLAIVDARDPTPVWVYDTVSGSMTQVWPGSGWDVRADQKWIDDPQNFNGG